MHRDVFQSAVRVRLDLVRGVLGAIVVTVALVAGCSADSSAPATSVVPQIFTGTTAATTLPSPGATTAPTTTAVTTTTTAPDLWPVGAPKVDLYEDDHYQRTEQLEAFNDWRGNDSTRDRYYSLYTKPGSVAADIAQQNLELRQTRPETNDCMAIVDSVTPWRTTDDGTIWIQITASSPECTGTLDGKSATRAFIPLQARYWHWEQQRDGRWLVIERLDSKELLAP
jgi:hypothetical protein